MEAPTPSGPGLTDNTSTYAEALSLYAVRTETGPRKASFLPKVHPLASKFVSPKTYTYQSRNFLFQKLSSVTGLFEPPCRSVKLCSLPPCLPG